MVLLQESLSKAINKQLKSIKDLLPATRHEYDIKWEAIVIEAKKIKVSFSIRFMTFGRQKYF